MPIFFLDVCTLIIGRPFTQDGFLPAVYFILFYFILYKYIYMSGGLGQYPSFNSSQPVIFFIFLVTWRCVSGMVMTIV